MFKLKNLSTVQSIQILCWENITSVNTIKQDLESAIDKAYQKMNSEDPVAIISQMITDRVCHSCYYLLSDYSLKIGYVYYYGKFYLHYKV